MPTASVVAGGSFLRQGLCNQGWPLTHGFPALAFQVLGLQSYTTLPGLCSFFFLSLFV